MLHDVPDALALGGFQLLLQVRQHRLQIFRRLLRLRYVLRLPGQVGVQPVQHSSGVFLYLPHIELQQLIQLIHPDVVAGAALQASAVVGAAAVGVLDVPAAHGEHGGAAVAAEQEAGVHVVILLLPPVVGGGAALPQGSSCGEGAVVDDLLVVVLNDDVVQFVPLDFFAVDFPAGVLALAQGADVEVVVQNPLDRHDGPHRLGGPLVLLSGGLFAVPLRHAWGGDALVGEMIGDFLIPPAVDVQPEYLPDDLRLGGHNLELLPLVHNVTVGCGADPLAVRLAALDNCFHFFAGVGDGHFVDHKVELDFQPIVVVGIIHVFPHGDNTDPGVPEVLQLHQAPAVAAGKTGEVLDNEDVLLVAHQLPAHGLIALSLLKGVAGAIPILVKGQGAVGKFFPDKVRDDGLLVLNGGVVPVQLLVHGDAAVAGDVKFLNHPLHPFPLPVQLFRISSQFSICSSSPFSAAFSAKSIILENMVWF